MSMFVFSQDSEGPFVLVVKSVVSSWLCMGKGVAMGKDEGKGMEWWSSGVVEV